MPFCSDWPDLSSRCCVADEPPPRSDEGPLCCAEEPPAPPSRICAFAKPAPAITAAAATEIKKRLVIEFLLTCLHCPRRQQRRTSDCSSHLAERAPGGLRRSVMSQAKLRSSNCPYQHVTGTPISANHFHAVALASSEDGPTKHLPPA